MYRTKKFELVELVIPANSTGTRFNFPDIPKLRYTALRGLETWSVSDIPVSSANNPLVSVADFQQSFLVLYSDGREDLYRIPLAALHRTQSGSTFSTPFVRALAMFDGMKITWEKSYIQTATSVAATQFSYLLGVYYDGQ